MKRKIRKHVFESNSSSVHSISISKNGREPSRFELNEDGKIEVDFGSFGRNYDLFTSQYEKLSYLMTCLYYLSGYGDIDEICRRWDFEQIEEAVCGYANATGIKIIGEVEPYIDHQSIPYGEIDIINIWDKDAVIDFVFNKYVTLKTDSD